MPMTDYLQSLKYNQLFGDGSPASLDVPDIPEAPSHLTPFVPQHQASDFLSDVLHDIPQRHNPGMMQKIFASIAGLAGPSAAPTQDNILNGGYNDQMKDWNTKVAAGTNAANLERSSNTSAQTAYNQDRGREIQQQRADTYGRNSQTTAKDQASKEQDRLAKQDIEKKKLELAQFKVNNPTYIYKTSSNGEILAFNPQNPQEKPLKTGVNSGDLGDLEKHNLRLSEIEAQGEQNRETKGTPGASQEVTPSTTTTKSTTTDSTGKESTTKRVVTKAPANGKTYSGKKVKMVGPNNVTYMVPVEEVETSKKKYGMKEVP